MRVTRSRTLRAGAPDVWAVLADPYALPRWWPLARRVEGVTEGGWTVVLGREGGREGIAEYLSIRYVSTDAG